MRLATSQTFLNSGSWTAPAGVTRVLITNGLEAGPFSTSGPPIAVDVTPGSTYVITINVASGAVVPSTFGSLYSSYITWYPSLTNLAVNPLTISWIDG